uniref:Uncharacterized protein n=1 Tax=Rangifer tarandus platyrhynchus TaxID=3082113 RepID=A0ACB0FKU1_RANTA|nr:unnamed protein product [Rangifer tarandus platyrhynchus]
MPRDRGAGRRVWGAAGGCFGTRGAPKLPDPARRTPSRSSDVHFPPTPPSRPGVGSDFNEVEVQLDRKRGEKFRLRATSAVKRNE